MSEKTNTLTSGNIERALLAFVLPMMLGSLIQQLYTTADAVIVGQFAGKAGLAAIDSVHTLFKFPINFMNGLAAGATILISGAFGAKDKGKLQSAIRTALAVAAGLGVLSAVGGFLLTPWLLQIMAVPEDIYDLTLVYCRIYFGGIWAMILYNMAAGVLRALGDTRRPLYVLILCSGVNIAADLLLVGVFRMGVGGAAAATVASQIISVICTFFFLSRSVPGGLNQASDPGCNRSDFTAMIRTGFPLALQAMLFPIANTIVQASVNTMGTDQIAAWGICEKLDMLIWLIADAMSPALTTYVAQNIGAKKLDRVRKGVLIGTFMSAGAVAAVSAVLFFGSGILGPWFLAAEDAGVIVPLVVRYMHLMGPFFVFYALAEAFSGACCGMGDTLLPMLTTLGTICLLRVIGILAVLPSFDTMECIVWIYIVSWIAAGCAFTLMFVRKSHRLLRAGAQ